MFKHHHHNKSRSTSWQPASQWYNKLVGKSGHYHHQQIIIPGVLRLLNILDNGSLLDLACGQGVLARHLASNIYYQGIDISKSLILSAKQQDKNPKHFFVVGNIIKTLPINKNDFTHAAIILSLQNVAEPGLTLNNCQKHLKPNGKLIIVINHPCFRIPRQSSWGMDDKNKTQYRRINRYLSPLKIPITIHPGINNSPITWSYHYSLSNLSQFINQAGFVIEKIEEWTSDKQSTGTAAKMENYSRNEFPLFMAILARKLTFFQQK